MQTNNNLTSTKSIIDWLIANQHNLNIDKLLEEKKEYLNEEVVIAFRRYTSEVIRQSVEKSLHLIKILEIIAQVTRSYSAQIHTIWIKGIISLRLNHYEDAIKYFQEASIFFREEERSLELAAMQINQVLAHRGLGEYTNALNLVDHARRACLKITDRIAKEYLANLEIIVAWIHYEIGQPTRAIQCCKKAKTMHLKLGNYGLAASADSDRAYFLSLLNRFQEAKDLLILTQQTFTNLGYLDASIKVDLKLGILAHKQGQYQTAIRYFEKTYHDFSELGLPVEIANVNMHRSTLYKELNLLQETIVLADAAIQVFRQSKMQREHIRGLVNQGIAYQRLGRYEVAVGLLAKARRMLHQQGAWGKLWALDVDRAELAWQMGQVKTAWRIGRRVENKIEATIYPSLAARLHLLLAQCHLSQQSRLDEAHVRVEKALHLCQQYHLAEIGVKGYALMGRLLEVQEDLNGAWQQLQQAVDASERLLSYLSMDEFQMGFMEGKLGVYADFVRLSHILATTSETFPTAVLLHSLNLMQTAPLPHNTAVSPHLTDNDRLTELRQRWQWFQHKLGGGWQEKKESNEADTRAELHAIELEMAELMRRQRIQQTDEMKEATSSTALLPDELLQAIQQKLAVNEGLLQYYEANDHFHALLITPTNTHLLSDLVKIEALQKVMRAWHFYLRQAQSGRTPSALPYLARLHKMLMGRLVNVLVHCDHLYLVLPPKWHDLPLAALYDGQQYFIEQHRLTYLSAASVLLTYQRQAFPEEPQAFVIGYDNNGRLPHAPQEAQTVSHALTPTWQVHQAIANSATAASFRETSQTSHLIHLATHAVFRPDNPYFSWIQLAASSLTVADMYHITLPKRPLVVLSACETGRGLARGGGLLGMGRGFLAAGASGLVVTLWRVSDKATSQFVDAFYTHLIQKHDVAAVLQMAQKTAVAASLPPFFWAGFIFVCG